MLASQTSNGEVRHRRTLPLFVTDIHDWIFFEENVVKIRAVNFRQKTAWIRTFFNDAAGVPCFGRSTSVVVDGPIREPIEGPVWSHQSDIRSGRGRRATADETQTVVEGRFGGQFVVGQVRAVAAGADATAVRIFSNSGIREGEPT